MGENISTLEKKIAHLANQGNVVAVELHFDRAEVHIITNNPYARHSFVFDHSC